MRIAFACGVLALLGFSAVPADAKRHNVLFMVVNDTLYLSAGMDGAAGTTVFGDLYVTARVRARVVRLGSKDWMALALQSTASDN